MKKEKYFLYARKSSESEDRQVESIDSQLNVLRELAQKLNITIIEEFTESKSAKGPGRPIFNKMIEKINDGEACGIICWKLDRLARNPIDGGTIMWMLQKNVIHNIQTHDRIYKPTDNVLLMSVELGMANQFLIDLKKNTVRGMDQKANRGWITTQPPLGYLPNPIKTKGQDEIINDPERFVIMKKLFQLMLTRQYSVKEISEIATNKFGLRSRKGNKMALSNFHRIFKNTFYYGEFEYPKSSGNWFVGKHTPIISKAEYDIIQNKISGNNNPRPKKYNFTYTGMIRCGECGAMITAEEKTKKQKNGNVHNYTYYHCTKRKNPNCSQKSIEVAALEKQIQNQLDKISLPKEFIDWTLKQLKKQNTTRSSERAIILANLQRQNALLEKKLDNLLDLRLNEEITSKDFSKKKNELMNEKSILNDSLKDMKEDMEESYNNFEEVFNFANTAKEKFIGGTNREKKQILSALSSKLVLKDRKLEITYKKPLLLLNTLEKDVKTKMLKKDMFEPIHIPINIEGNEVFTTTFPVEYPRRDSNL